MDLCVCVWTIVDLIKKLRRTVFLIFFYLEQNESCIHLQREPNSKDQATTLATVRDRDLRTDTIPSQLTYPSNQVFVQPDDLVPHPCAEPIANPLRVKSFEALDGRARLSSDETTGLSPRSLTILLKAEPNKLLNVVLVPTIMTKDFVIARNLDGPQCNTMEQKPEPTN